MLSAQTAKAAKTAEPAANLVETRMSNIFPGRQQTLQVTSLSWRRGVGFVWTTVEQLGHPVRYRLMQGDMTSPCIGRPPSPGIRRHIKPAHLACFIVTLAQDGVCFRQFSVRKILTQQYSQYRGFVEISSL